MASRSRSTLRSARCPSEQEQQHSDTCVSGGFGGLERSSGAGSSRSSGAASSSVVVVASPSPPTVNCRCGRLLVPNVLASVQSSEQKEQQSDVCSTQGTGKEQEQQSGDCRCGRLLNSVPPPPRIVGLPQQRSGIC